LGKSRLSLTGSISLEGSGIRWGVTGSRLHYPATCTPRCLFRGWWFSRQVGHHSVNMSASGGHGKDDLLLSATEAEKVAHGTTCAHTGTTPRYGAQLFLSHTHTERQTITSLSWCTCSTQVERRY
jgi:hypothetical protein